MWPVLYILELDVRVPVNEVDADELVAAFTLEAWLTLTCRHPRLILTESAVLALSQLTGGSTRRSSHLTKLTTVGQTCWID